MEYSNAARNLIAERLSYATPQNMNPQTLPINEILVEDRQRQDLGDIKALAESLQRFGLIQPIIVNQQKRLIAGGRRLAAATRLGWSEVSVVYRETLSADELHELELEENIRRKDISWQERVLAIASIHRLKCQRNALEGRLWGYRETGELLGVALGNISFALNVAQELKDKASAFWQCETPNDARRIMLRRQQDEYNAELARRQQISITSPNEEKVLRAEAKTIEAASADPNLLAYERERYNSNPLNPIGGFDEYWSNRQKEIDKINRSVYLSNKLYLADAIEFMKDPDNAGRFDHIVTDPPYAIDMAMLNQQNPHGQMVDIDTVLEEHDVETNLELFQNMFHAAQLCLAENAFFVLWCDQMLWDILYNQATSAGFKVQRWPLTWVKTHRCMNQCAQYNFTKTTEIAMVCRKGNAVLVDPAPTSHIVASHDEMKDKINHPFVKPFAVWEFMLKYISIKGQTIYDPFAGRGSGVLSALRMERNVVATEVNEAHYNALLENVKQYYLSLNPRFVFK